MIAALPEASAVTIADDWWGFSPDSPVEQHYYLERQGATFAGTFRHVRGGGSGDHGGKQDFKVSGGTITIPLDSMSTFLKTLAQAPFSAGKYEPKTTHTDNYPAKTIQIITAAGTLTLLTDSNDQDYVPWGATFGGKSYVINADTPTRALDTLRESLRQQTARFAVPSPPTNSLPLPCRNPAPPPDPIAAHWQPTPDGATINPVEYLNIFEPHTFIFLALGTGRVALNQPEPVAEMLALLDGPLPAVALSDFRDWTNYEYVVVGFQRSDGRYIWMGYEVARDVIWLPDREPTAMVQAPPGFAAALVKYMCARWA